MKFTTEQLNFIEKARISISDDPRTRLNTVVKEIIDDDNCIFDAHCHVFDGKCINLKYLAIRMIAGAVEEDLQWVWRLIKREYHSEKHFFKPDDGVGKNEIIELIYNKIIIDNDISPALDRMQNEIEKMEVELVKQKEDIMPLKIKFIHKWKQIIEFLQSNSMEEVFKKFEQEYAIHHLINKYNGGNAKLVTIVLGMDLNKGWDDSIPKKWEEQNSELTSLSKKYPILPFLPIDPRRENLYEVFLEAFNQKNPQFFGVKCYPALGYLPSHDRLMPIFQICAEKNIPVMTHCGGEKIFTFDYPIKTNRRGDTVVINDSDRKLRARKLNEPTEWEYVLQEYNKLRLCFGHFGGKYAWENNQEISHRINEILSMMKNYENVYADFSFNIESHKAVENFTEMLSKDDINGKLMRERTLFGTDFWVILPSSDLIEAQKNFINKINNIDNKNILLKSLLRKNVLNFLKLNK
ncbi:MAG TPA: amidohydrolase family protein [Bacteroidia bacterium]|nr:amidohydrolase family protein [Bacteroidia bacterium]